MSLKEFAIVDTTLREGEQFYKTNFSSQDKIEIARQLSDFGTEYIELTSPFASPGSRTDCETIAKMGLKSKIITHIRCTKEDAILAIDTGVSGINFFAPSSKHHGKTNAGKQDSQILEEIINVLRFTREQAPGIKIRFSLEDTFRAPVDKLSKIYMAIGKSGLVDRLGITDTVGIALPHDIEKVVTLLKSLGQKEIEFHGHNDTQSAVINSYAALKAGATHIDTSVLGIGERNGITSLAGFIARMYSLEADLIKAKYNLDQFKKLHTTVARIVGIDIPFNHPIVGESAFIHKAGIHTNAVILNPKSYEIIDPADFDELRTILIAHKLTGWNAIKNRAEKFKLTFEDNEIKEIALKIKKMADEENITLKSVDKILIANYEKKQDRQMKAQNSPKKKY
ncbi:MAG: homocitrate synthase [Desulfobacteraceae bacterium]|nr:homocitrate synthase [Desulfobacteraceae bacterium]